MKESKFTNYQVKNIGDTLQTYMQKENIPEMSANMCAELLDKLSILPKGKKRIGSNFRQMLRDGRDGLIQKMIGVEQEKPRTKWLIKKVD